MSTKNIVTAALLLFVGFSLFYLFASEARPPAVQEEQSQLSVDRADYTAQASKSTPAAPIKGRRVVAFYFHTTQRCVTCRTIEALTLEAIETGFADALEGGRLEWLPVNVQVPDNEHFIQDYQLTTKSVVLVEMTEGEQRRWKNLDKVWHLVRDKNAFVTYIQEETREFLSE